MRIISGKYRGKRLLAPEGRGTRPTSEKVRESIFNILASLGHVGGRVLDLFAGTGALGIEAISRGAEDAVFVEKNPEAASIARKNLASLGINCRVYNTDWKVAVRKLSNNKQFDIIFLDPPYAKHEESNIIKAISNGNLLANNGCIVVEHASDNTFNHNGYTAHTHKYSDTSVTVLHKKAKSPLCVFPGTFDPFTLGHRDVVLKALEDYDKVIVAVADITYRENVKDLRLRSQIAELSIKDLTNVSIETFKGMLTDYLKENGCNIIVRGLRNEEDKIYEDKIADVYKKAMPDIKIVYYTAEHPMISSHAVRNMLSDGHTDRLDDFIFPEAQSIIKQNY